MSSFKLLFWLIPVPYISWYVIWRHNKRYKDNAAGFHWDWETDNHGKSNLMYHWDYTK